MTQHLQTLHANPLEREFESWIVASIERALSSVGIAHAIWAVSPMEEAQWPSDERLCLGAKFVGLQFKQAKVGPGKRDASRLHWSLHQPKGQFSLVRSFPEIYYCLPTFVNRAFRSRALDHCLFWRPGKSDDKSLWYDNDAARSDYSNLSGSMRWGFFLESLLNCTVGTLGTNRKECDQWVSSLYGTAREFVYNAMPYENSGERAFSPGTGLYALAIARPS